MQHLEVITATPSKVSHLFPEHASRLLLDFEQGAVAEV